jgi:hypothetical protein
MQTTTRFKEVLKTKAGTLCMTYDSYIQRKWVPVKRVGFVETILGL